jgi:hypothetical protein
MKRTTLLAAVALLALTANTSPALAEDTEPGPGFLCGFASVTDPNTEGGTTQVGEIDGGPIVVTDEGLPVEGYLLCSIQVGESTHAGTDAAGATTEGFGVVTLAPSVISYESPAGVPVYLCTEIWVQTGRGHVGWFWNDSNDPTVEGSWSLDPNASCGLAIEAGGDDGDPAFELLNASVCPILLSADSLTGNTLRLAETWEDCEPYSPII